jgi:hypothetical protein
MDLTQMIVKPRLTEGGRLRYTVLMGSRAFSILRSARDDEWETYDRDALLAAPVEQMFDVTPCLDVSGDLSGSLEYIESLFQ